MWEPQENLDPSSLAHSQTVLVFARQESSLLAPNTTNPEKAQIPPETLQLMLSFNLSCTTFILGFE